MLLYRIGGMNVASEVALPGAWLLDSGEPDVVMRQGAVPPALANPQAITTIWEADESHFLLRVEGIGRFLTSRGCEVVFEPEDGVPLSECAVYLQGSVIGTLLNQRGGIVMHASAVAVDGQAVLFCGKSGAGKSTLAATLSLRGHGLISDDICLIRFSDRGRPTVCPDARKLKLADTAIEALALDAQRGEPVLGNAEKTYVGLRSSGDQGELPLGAIYVLCARYQGLEGITAFDHATALKRLQGNAYRPGVIKRTGQAARYFAASTRMMQHARVFRIERERNLSRLSAAAVMVEDHWKEIGLWQG